MTTFTRLCQRPTVIGLLLALVIVATFLPVAGFDFVNADDPGYFAANPNVQAGLSWQGLRWAFRTHEVESHYPLTWLSFMVDAELFGNGPAGPHLTNLLLHVANALLLLGLLRRLTGPGWGNVFIASAFALHPLHVESVAWVSERKGVLSTLFLLLALWAYTRYATTQAEGRDDGKTGGRPTTAEPAARNRHGNSRLALRAALWYLVALLWFALGLLSKPMLVTLPCVMLLLDYWPLRRLERRDGRLRLRPRLVLEKLPFFVLAGISSIIQVHVAQQAGALSTLGNSPLSARIGNALVSYLRYLGKLFWPVDLAFPYLYPGRWPPGEVILAGALLGGVTVFSLCRARRRPWLVVGWFWFLGMLVPVLGLVQWGNEAMADRFTYVPLVGLFLVLAMGAAELPQRLFPRMVLASAAVLLVLACALRTRNQLQYWRNGEMLARHAIAVTKDNYVAYNVLGGCLYRAGRLDEAISSFRTAVEINPRFASAENNLGLALAHQGKRQEAMRHYRLALEYSPAYPQAMINLGDALTMEGRLDEAIQQYREALRRDPDLASALNNLALVLLRKKNYAEAITYYREALAIAPQNAAAYKNLGLALAALGDVQQAIGCLETALRLNPDLPDAAQQLEALTARAKTGAPHP